MASLAGLLPVLFVASANLRAMASTTSAARAISAIRAQALACLASGQSFLSCYARYPLSDHLR